jgi:hypothetical protein
MPHVCISTLYVKKQCLDAAITFQKNKKNYLLYILINQAKFLCHEIQNYTFIITIHDARECIAT